ncbi:MAG: sulfatase activating formylglycine-generating enzyme [Verrucomicrobiales bacterium]|jgi:formylglycine-generating enzyme required for sulfatase activity
MKFAKPLLLGLFLIFAAATVWSAEVRTWTDLKGRTLEGSLVKIDGEEVVILLESGKEVRLKREGLSPADGQYLEEHILEGKRAAGEERVYEGITFIWCPPGEFRMGSPVTEEGRRKNGEIQHVVKLPRGFWLAKFECTQGQYEALMGENPSRFKGADDLPVDRVSWDDAQIYCKKLGELIGQQAGWKVTLPTEGQWEYACRAGTTEAYAGKLDEIAWYDGNSDKKPHPVGEKKPNPWGICDMHGNVKEWCQNWLERDPHDHTRAPYVPDSRSTRVYRGSCFGDEVQNCRSAIRGGDRPSYISILRGFRVAVSFNE